MTSTLVAFPSHRSRAKLPLEGLATGLHEVLDARAGDKTASLAFVMALSTGTSRRTEKPICFCALTSDAQEYGALYGHTVGLPPERLFMVSVANEKHLLWTLEEALAANAFGAVIGMFGATERLYGFPESRRLKLRVAETSTPFYLLRHHTRGGATAAHGRWGIETSPSRAGGTHAGFELLGPPRLRLTLEKMGGLPPQQWEMEYDGTCGFHMAAVLPDRVDRATDERRRQAV